MLNFTVFQYHMDRKLFDLVNELGWAEAINLHPEISIKRELSWGGSTKFEGWMIKHFIPVAHFDAEDLDEVFHFGNVGPKEKIEMITKTMRSVSVGDIIRDNKTNTYHMVDVIGFSQLPDFNK